MSVSLVDQLPRSRITACFVDNAIPLEPAYTQMRFERMIIIVIGFLPVLTKQQAFASAKSFDWHAAAMCIATPWAAFLMKVYYFDLAGAHRTHATEISSPRALLWSLSHLPLFASILWFSIAQTKLLGSTSVLATSADAHHWQLCASFSLFLFILTIQQMLHTGTGHGNRRCGKHRRVAIRILGMVALIAATPGINAIQLQSVENGSSTLERIGVATWSTSKYDAAGAMFVLISMVWLTLMATAEWCARMSYHAASVPRVILATL